MNAIGAWATCAQRLVKLLVHVRARQITQWGRGTKLLLFAFEEKEKKKKQTVLCANNDAKTASQRATDLLSLSNAAAEKESYVHRDGFCSYFLSRTISFNSASVHSFFFFFTYVGFAFVHVSSDKDRCALSALTRGSNTLARSIVTSTLCVCVCVREKD